MIKLNSYVTDSINFYEGLDPFELMEKFGSPLYVYNERILRKNCREMKNLVKYQNFKVNYSAKANTNLALLEIVRDEGLDIEAVSPGEIYIELMAGFKSSQIIYVSNNVSEDDMRFAIDRDVTVCVDSLSQLEQFGRINTGGRVAVRFNPGIGAGHHEKVMTAGKNTKFGVNPEHIGEVKEILLKYNLKLIGIHQHIGSLFLEDDKYIAATENLLSIARHFDALDYIDLGGGFGIPYKKQKDQQRLDLTALGEKLTGIMEHFSKEYGRQVMFKTEPGRYIPAESAVLLGTVHAVKYNGETKYAGSDIGFNVLMRPVLYDSHHDIEVYSKNENSDRATLEKVTIVGNICETGDILAKERELPEIMNGDAICILDAGSYGYAMSSNYNSRLRPAEILIREDGHPILIRETDTYEDLTRHMKSISL